MNQGQLATAFGVSTTCVAKIVLGQTWRHLLPVNSQPPHVGGNYATPRGECAPSAKLTLRQAADIRAAYAAGGTSYRHLAAVYSVSHTAIAEIVHGRHYSDCTED